MAAACSFHQFSISSSTDTSPSSHPNAPSIELAVAGDGAIDTNAPQRGKLGAGQQYSVQLGFLKKHRKGQADSPGLLANTNRLCNF